MAVPFHISILEFHHVMIDLFCSCLKNFGGNINTDLIKCAILLIALIYHCAMLPSLNGISKRFCDIGAGKRYKT